MKFITIFDTYTASTNIGDQIIMDSINDILHDLFKNDFFVRVQTHDVISKQSYQYLKKSHLSFVAGTNLLSSNMNVYNQWKINLWDSFFIKNVLLLGVGWWQYQKKPNFYTRILLKRILNGNLLHSVRDEYTKNKLKSIGIDNVINTSCPTMWKLTPEHCSNIPRKKSSDVLVTFTEYNQNIDLDFNLLELLKKKYENLYFWTQQPKDFEYMYAMGGNNIHYIPPNLDALDKFMNNHDVDYVGTRLHAGIRALLHKKRSLLLSVDNRSAEIANDTNLPVINRKDIDAILQWIDNDYITNICIPEKNIQVWKSQFK